MAGPEDEARDAQGKWTAGGGGLDPTKQPGLEGLVARADKALHPISTKVDSIDFPNQPTMPVYINPNADQLIGFMKNRDIKTARGIINMQTGDAFWWNGESAIHEDVASHYGFSSMEHSANLMLKRADNTIQLNAPGETDGGNLPSLSRVAASPAIKRLTASGKLTFKTKGYWGDY